MYICFTNIFPLALVKFGVNSLRLTVLLTVVVNVILLVRPALVSELSLSYCELKFDGELCAMCLLSCMSVLFSEFRFGGTLSVLCVWCLLRLNGGLSVLCVCYPLYSVS